MFLLIDNVTPGTKAVRDVVNVNGAVLLTAGAQLTPEILRRLKMWGIKGLHVEGREADDPDAGGAAIEPLVLRRAEELVGQRFRHVTDASPTVNGIRELAVKHAARHPEVFQLALGPVTDRPRGRPGPDSRRRSTPVEEGGTDRLSQFLYRSPNLPSLPAIYYELVQVADRMDASISDIARIILKDQALVSRLLRLANSAFYGRPSQIATIDEAVHLIGVVQIRDLVLATSVIKAFANLPEQLLDVRSFWEHSIACGLASALLAEARKDPLPERLFIGGLLHDIGRLFMLLQAPEESGSILQRCQDEGALASRMEREVLGFDHAALGAELLTAWRLPGALIEMVRHHHMPSKGPDSQLIHYADFIASALPFGNSGEFFVSPLVASEDQDQNLAKEGHLKGLVEEVEKRCEEMLPIFGQART